MNSKATEVIVDLKQQQDTIEAILNQLNKFGTPQQAYLLTGDIVKFRGDLAKTTSILSKLIGKWEKVADQPVQTTLVHGSGTSKQNTHTERGRTSVGRK
jgi:CHASE3 domain sensor protein